MKRALFPTKRILAHAYAKLNLGLWVLGPRADGYHEIATLFQSVNVADTLAIERLPGPAVEVYLRPDLGILASDNVVTRAAELLLDEADSDYGVRIEVRKQIPLSAGLGGGSSDAAATLVALNELFQFGFHPEDLKMLGLELGSDVPYFIEGGLCWGRGRGEILEKWPNRFSGYHFALLVPPFGLSSKEVYEAHDHLHNSRPLADGATDFSMNDFPQSGHCHNDLEAAALQLRPPLSAFRELVMRCGAALYGMSGSGPTYYAAFAEADAARALLQSAPPDAQIFLCRPTESGQRLTIPSEAETRVRQ